jgi:hypothetical protein
MAMTANSDAEVLRDGIAELLQDLDENPDSWENTSLAAYLEAINAWVNSPGADLPKEPSWEFVVKLLNVGRSYE